MEGIWSPPPSSRLYMQGCNGDQSAPDTRASHGPCSPVPKHPPRITPHPQVPRHQSSCRSWQETGGEVVRVCVRVCFRLRARQRCSWTVCAAVLSVPSNSKTRFSTDESAALTHTQTPCLIRRHTTHTHNARARSIITNVEEMTLL